LNGNAETLKTEKLKSERSLEIYGETKTNQAARATEPGISARDESASDEAHAAQVQSPCP